jgi:NDP-sugar pyrophosphorylase family protein
MLEITLARLRAFGIREVIVNVHHFAEMIVDYLKTHNDFGMRIEISREELLLDTGGGLKKAAHFFLENASDLEAPFILHNVDIVSTIDLRRMVQFHNDHRALATLAVQDRQSTRYLLFDQQHQLCGREPAADSEAEVVRPSEQMHALAFCGMHVISPGLLGMMTETGVFSIIDCYLRLAGRGEKIVAFRADESYWSDIGTPEKLQQARQELGRFQDW